jgi:glycine cleavage system H protein
MVALFIIATFLFFLGIDYLIQRKRKPIEAVGRASPPAERFVIPRGYFFSPKHAWVELLGTGYAHVGIDDFIQKVVGAIDGIRAVPENTVVRRGDPILTIVQNGRELTIPSPISGRVLEVNNLLMQSPELLRKDPYVAGWVARIEPESLGTELKTLNLAEEAANWLRQEVARFRDFITVRTPQLATGVTMLDGGVPMVGVLQGAEENVWKDFEQEFLLTTHEQA